MSILHHNEPAQQFEVLRHAEESGEYWLARDLQALLGYSGWRDFVNAIERAKVACTNSGVDLTSNFADVRKVVSSGPAAADYRLSRYACYLVAMNGDPRKAEIAAAQTYFAAKTREAEMAAVPSQRGELDTLDVLRAALDHIADVRRTAVTALSVADGAQALGEENSARLDGMEGRTDWYVALAYAKLHKLPTSLSFLQRLGRAATAIAVTAGIEAHKVACERWASVNSYPEWVWGQAVQAIAPAAS